MDPTRRILDQSLDRVPRFWITIALVSSVITWFLDPKAATGERESRFAAARLFCGPKRSHGECFWRRESLLEMLFRCYPSACNVHGPGCEFGFCFALSSDSDLRDGVSCRGGSFLCFPDPQWFQTITILRLFTASPRADFISNRPTAKCPESKDLHMQREVSGSRVWSGGGN